MFSTGIPGTSIECIAANKVLLYWKQVIFSIRCSVDRVIARVSYVAFNIVRFMTDCCDLLRRFAVLSLPRTVAATA